VFVYKYNVYRCVCPDVTHMLVRCVETDLKRMAQRICDVKAPNHDLAISRLEMNLTAREAKKPAFTFDRTTPQNAAGKVRSVSLSGSGALTVIADTCELKEAVPNITDLYHDVWLDEVVFGTGELYSNSVAVLKSMFPELFTRGPVSSATIGTYISYFDASELLRRSLNNSVIILRDSREGLDVHEFKRWSEVYYQTSLLLFGVKGVTPYKMKLTLFPPLIASGYITSPWYHMCESLEKSNHHAHKDFQSRTMRGGGFIYTQDPLFLEGFFSFCKFLKLSSSNENMDLSVIQSRACEAVHGYPLEESIPPTYLEVNYFSFCATGESGVIELKQ